jgi:hypothetical protein
MTINKLKKNLIYGSVHFIFKSSIKTNSNFLEIYLKKIINRLNKFLVFKFMQKIFIKIQQKIT